MSKVTHAKIVKEFAPGREATYIVKLDGIDPEYVILDTFIRTKDKKRSERNGRPVTKFVSSTNGSEAWVYSDCSVMK